MAAAQAAGTAGRFTSAQLMIRMVHIICQSLAPQRLTHPLSAGNGVSPVTLPG
jgi:hypothetical protein